LNTDIRIAVSFKSHRKRKKFRLLLGEDDATDYLIDFWITVATDRPDGNLRGLDNIDIALMAGYNGDPNHFVTALQRAGFIDDNDGELVVHQWTDHNGYASSSVDRSDRSRFCRMARTHPDLYSRLKTKGVNAISSDDFKRLTTVKRPLKNSKTTIEAQVKEPLTNRTSPSPLPSPLPSPSIQKEKDSASADAAHSPGNKTGGGKGGEKFYVTRKGKKLTGKKLLDFERFWKEFRYPKDKANAADAWLGIIGYGDELVAKIIAGAEREARARPSLVERGYTPKWAQGWLAARRWEDEEQGAASAEGNQDPTPAELEALEQLKREKERRKRALEERHV